jgi:hypothetical protein
MGRGLLAKVLDELGDSRPSPEWMLDVVDRLSNRDALVEILLDTVGDTRKLAAVAASSVRHANGFQKIVLAARGSQIRLHIWEPRVDVETCTLENAHNHRWCFATTILVGSYRATTFMPVDGESHTRYVYTPSRDPQDYHMTRMGLTDLVQTSVANYAAGSRYWVHPTLVHRVSPVVVAGMTASLLIIGPSSRASADVFAPRVSTTRPVGNDRHTPLSQGDVVRSLTNLADVLGIS